MQSLKQPITRDAWFITANIASVPTSRSVQVRPLHYTQVIGGFHRHFGILTTQGVFCMRLYVYIRLLLF